MLILFFHLNSFSSHSDIIQILALSLYGGGGDEKTYARAYERYWGSLFSETYT
jgi:hypothetical protein